METNNLAQRLQYSQKKTAFAWAKYYESVNNRLTADHRHYTTITQTVVVQSSDGIPAHIKDELIKMSTELKKQWECPVCMDMIKPDTLDITNCGHYFCKGCLAQLKSSTLGTHCKCPICRRSIKKD